MIKMELQAGSSSIKLEGEIDDVERILAAYWHPRSNVDQSEGATGNAGHQDLSGKRRTKRSQSKSTTGDPVSSRTEGLDAEQIANNIKIHPSFGQFKSKILSVKGDWISKCKMVALVANTPITSGDVGRVLTILRVKFSLPRLSEALSGNSADFLTQGVSPVRYTMTSVAEDEFKAWVGDVEKETA
jgi:hypothetical protein